MLRRHAGEPLVLVGREDTVGRAGLGQQFPPLKYDMVLAGVKGNASSGEPAEHPGVAHQRLWLIVVSGENRLHAQLACERDDFGRRYAVAHDQGSASLTAELAQVGVELAQGVSNELDTAVAARQGIENLGVKDKCAIKLLAGLQRQAQCGVVADAQIAPKPNQTCVKLLVHDHQ